MGKPYSVYGSSLFGSIKSVIISLCFTLHFQDVFGDRLKDYGQENKDRNEWFSVLTAVLWEKGWETGNK